MLTFILTGDPRTKKNSMRVITRPYPRLLPSKQYEEYEAACIAQITECPALASPVNVRCVYYMQTRRKVDLANLLEATDDILVKAGVLTDDNSQIVAAHDGSRVRYDKDHPRVEITITELEEQPHA